jgi:hypothetical protein
MAYDNDTVKVISVPLSKEAHEILLEIAGQEKRSKTAQAGYMLEKLLMTSKKQKE